MNFKLEISLVFSHFLKVELPAELISLNSDTRLQIKFGKQRRGAFFSCFISGNLQAAEKKALP